MSIVLSYPMVSTNADNTRMKMKTKLRSHISIGLKYDEAYNSDLNIGE